MDKNFHNWKNIGEFMNDQIECSCGWKSMEYFDGFNYAMDEFQKHVMQQSDVSGGSNE